MSKWCLTLLLCIFMHLFVTPVASSKAPDVSPELPEGWCVEGHATKTTGECICSPSVCIGPKCHRDQGFEWYKLDCPSCRCLKRGESKPKTKAPTVVKSQALDGEGEGEGAIKTTVEINKVGVRPVMGNGSDDPMLILAELVEDYPVVFLVLGTIAFMVVMYIVMFAFNKEANGLGQERDTGSAS